MATAELIERCMEEIATTVLDAGDAISYRTLGASSQVNADISRDALHKFVQENESSVGAIQVVVQQGVEGTGSSAHKSSSSPVDPRARVIRIESFSPEQSAEKVISTQIYSVYKKSAQDGADDAVEPISIACWSQERSLRNDIFQKVSKQAPLSRAIKSFYESGIKCVEATTRTGFGESQGEESISVFDSVKASKMPVSGAKSSNSSNSTPSAALNGSKSFFKSTGSATSTSKPRATSSASSSINMTPAAAKQPERKKIDAKSMSNVFTIDSDDDDDDGSDADAPVFVKKSQSGAAAKPRSKRVISDDEDEDEDDDLTKPASNGKSTKTPVAQSKKTSKATSNSSSSRSAKRKLNASPDEKSHVTLSGSDDEPKRTKRAKSIENDDDDDAVMAEAAAAEEEEDEPAEIQTKRRVETTKTRINEQGYMVTEKIVEEVELTAEEIEQERLQAAKKQQQAATVEAAKAAAEKKAAAAAKGGAPVKQKNLFAFFQRK
ncbi:hypothetical protein Gpo141_00000609 [Globisporangium polare]